MVTGARQPHVVMFGGVMALCMCVTALPTYALGTLAPFISTEMDLDKASLGSLTAALFVVGSLTSPVVGRLVDHLGGYRMLQASFVTSLVALVGFAAARSYAMMLAFIAVVGLGRAISNPVTNSLIAAGGVPGRLGTLMGITKSGAQIGAILAGVALPPLAAMTSWRVALAAAAVLGVIGLAATPHVIPRDRARGTRRPRRSEPVAMPASANWLSGYAFLMGAGIACVNAYLPLFAFEQVALSAATAGTVMGAMGLVSIPGRIVWARASERRANVATPLLVIAILSGLAIPLVMAAQWLGPAALWVGAVVFGLAASSWISVGMLTIVRISESGGSGKVSGRVLAGFYAGFVPSPVLFGYLVDVRGGYVYSWLGVTGTFVLAAAVAFVWNRRLRRAAGASVTTSTEGST